MTPITPADLIAALREDVLAGRNVPSDRYAYVTSMLRGTPKPKFTPHDKLPFGERRQRDRAKGKGFGTNSWSMRAYRFKRDQSIVSKIDEGATFSSVAKEHSLSPRRVNDIWKATKRLKNFNAHYHTNIKRKSVLALYGYLERRGIKRHEAIVEIIKSFEPKTRRVRKEKTK